MCRRGERLVFRGTPKEPAVYKLQHCIIIYYNNNATDNNEANNINNNSANNNNQTNNNIIRIHFGSRHSDSLHDG